MEKNKNTAESRPCFSVSFLILADGTGIINKYASKKKIELIL